MHCSIFKAVLSCFHLHKCCNCYMDRKKCNSRVCQPHVENNQFMWGSSGVWTAVVVLPMVFNLQGLMLNWKQAKVLTVCFWLSIFGGSRCDCIRFTLWFGFSFISTLSSHNRLLQIFLYSLTLLTLYKFEQCLTRALLLLSVCPLFLL